MEIFKGICIIATWGFIIIAIVFVIKNGRLIRKTKKRLDKLMKW